MSDDVEAVELLLDLPRAIDKELAADIEKQAVYVSEDLISLRVTADQAQVKVIHKASGDSAKVRDKATRFLDAMLQRFRRIEPTVHFRRPKSATARPTTQVFQQLLDRQWAFQHTEGVVSLSGPALALLHAVDESFSREYVRRFSASAREYPALIKASLLARCGYFEMHPNALSFVSHLVNDFDEIEAFRQANSESTELRTTHPGAFAPVHHCLNPAACFPCYENLENKSVPKSGLVLTWKGRVFRYESSNTVGLDRLREFNVRELVFIGTDDFVKKGRADAMELTTSLMGEWDLSGRIETATDPFFATVYAAKTFWQEAMDVKYEVCLDVEPSGAGTARSIAAGSMNLHGAFFGDRFNIRDHTNELAYTGCVGWGLERWVLAIFSQHGLEVEKWPRALRTQVS
jgi:seryl-tRNA synthetase